MRLPNLHGYLKIPGPYPVARIALDYVKRPNVAPRFVPRRPADGISREEDGYRTPFESGPLSGSARGRQRGDAAGNRASVDGDRGR